MSDLIDISHLHQQFKTDLEKQQFVEKQQELIACLNVKIKEQQEEISHLKRMLITNNEVEKVILTPEEALIEDQILLIQDRSYGKELSLEDVKKLDILLKAKKTIKDEKKTIKAESKTITFTNNDLLQIAQGLNESK
jgi:hypothetical protein